MKTRKLRSSVLVGASLLLALTGCGSNKTTNSASSGEGSKNGDKAKQTTISFWAAAVTTERNAFSRRSSSSLRKRTRTLRWIISGFPAICPLTSKR